MIESAVSISLLERVEIELNRRGFPKGGPKSSYRPSQSAWAILCFTSWMRMPVARFH
jgi:hypothetical protein